MATWLVVVLGLAFVVAVLLTTPAGRRLRQRLPIRVAEILERERQPELSEAEAYRRAIRRHLRPQS
jgi:hypothetical protein